MAYVANTQEHADVGIHWIDLCVLNNDFNYFDSFGIEHIPKEFLQFSVNKNMQADNLIMCGYFCIGFINCMLAGKTLIDFISLLSPDDFKKSDK